MATLEKLTAKILADSEAEAKRILEEAGAEAARITAGIREETGREKEKILADAQLEASRKSEQILIGGQLAARDADLAAKQQMLNKVFAEALQRLNAMPKEKFLQFAAQTLRGQRLNGEEIILPERYGFTIDEINAAVKAAGGTGVLVMGESRGIEGGFILRKGGIEQNNTFEALVEFYRYELESEVTRALYE